MLRYSFENITVLILSIFFIFKIIEISKLKWTTAIYKKILLSIYAGLPMLLLMIFKIYIRQDIYFDIGIITIVLITLYGGLQSLFFILTMIIICHLCFFGLNMISILYIITYIIVTICSQLVCKLETKKLNKFKCILLYSVIFSGLTFLIIVQNANSFEFFEMPFLFGISITLILAYYFTYSIK